MGNVLIASFGNGSYNDKIEVIGSFNNTVLETSPVSEFNQKVFKAREIRNALRQRGN